MLTKVQREYALKQYDRGVSPTKLGQEFGVTAAAIVNIARRAGLKPRQPKFGYGPAKRHKRQDLLEMREAVKAAGITLNASGMAVERDWLRLRELIPEDTRSLTARFFGDPLPGRSALDART